MPSHAATRVRRANSRSRGAVSISLPDESKTATAGHAATGTDLLCTPELVIELGIPADLLLQVAEAKPADLIVMGIHRTSAPSASAHAPWRTVHQVVCKVHCPVLTVCG